MGLGGQCPRRVPLSASRLPWPDCRLAPGVAGGKAGVCAHRWEAESRRTTMACAQPDAPFPTVGFNRGHLRTPAERPCRPETTETCVPPARALRGRTFQQKVTSQQGGLCRHRVLQQAARGRDRQPRVRQEPVSPREQQAAHVTVVTLLPPPQRQQLWQVQPESQCAHRAPWLSSNLTSLGIHTATVFAADLWLPCPRQGSGVCRPQTLTHRCPTNVGTSSLALVPAYAHLTVVPAEKLQ